MRDVTWHRVVIASASVGCCMLAAACERGAPERANAPAAARTDSIHAPSRADSTQPGTPARTTRVAGQSRPARQRTTIDSMGVRVPADESGRPVEPVGDWFGEHHGTPIDSLELVTIGTRRLEDIPDEELPCLGGDIWLPYSRLLLFADSAVSEWRTNRPRCLPQWPRWPVMMHSYAGSGKYRLRGDTITFYFPGNPTARPYDRWHGLLTKDSLLPLVPSDTARRYVRLTRRAPPPRKKVPPGLIVVGDTFDLVSVGPHSLDSYPRSGECDLTAEPTSERLLVLPGGKYVRRWVDDPNCRSVRIARGTANPPHQSTGMYRTHHDTLTFFEVDGSRLFEWMPGVLSADSLREMRAVPGLERRYARRPHHQPPIKNVLPELASHLLHKLNPAITRADVALVLWSAQSSPRRAVILHGVRSDSIYHGNPRDDLFVIVQTDSAFTRIERTIAVVPSPKWRDFGLEPSAVTKDSVLIVGWTLTMGDRAAEPLDRSPQWRWADARGWAPVLTHHEDNSLVQSGMHRWYKW